MDLIFNFRIISTVAIVFSRSSWIDGFIPNWQYRLPSVSFSKTHQNIIEDALRKVAKEYMKDHPDIYPAADQDKFLFSHSFTEAIETFRKFVAKPDLDADKKFDPAYHVDAERIIESNERLKTARSDILFQIVNKQFANARELTGLSMHTLQDFYSHSNWLEMTGSDAPYTDLGDKKLTALTRSVAAGDTCSDCSSSIHNACNEYICQNFVAQAGSGSTPFSNCLSISTIENCISQLSIGLTSITGLLTHCATTDTLQAFLSYLTSSNSSCRNNILDAVNSQGQLTTGYYYGDVGFSSKPSGKCSHGGPFDCTQFDHATGGINKDSSAEFVSPHYYLHFQAASAAVKATVLYLNWIREDLNEMKQESLFPQFIGLSTGNTLCFVIDTTSSMADEIAAVRNQTIQIIRDRSSGSDKPSNYLLVPFNDPGWGPAYTTTDPSGMIEKLSQLTAGGGGGVSEMGYHGIIMALQIVQPNSVCHFFTDAPAGDLDLCPTAIALKLSKNVKFEAWLTQFANFTGRRRRSMGRDRRQATQHTAVGDYSQCGFTRTGSGNLFVLRKMDIMAAVKPISVSLLQVEVFRCDDRQLGFEFFVDHSMSDVSLIVSDKLGSLQSINVTSTTNGANYTDFKTSVNLSNLKVYNFSTIAPGWWYVNVSTNSAVNFNGSFSASVQAASLIDFQFNFATFSGGTHPGYIQINNNPRAGSSYFILITITGSGDPTTNQTQSIQIVTHLLFLSTTGDILQNLTLSEVTPLEEYEAQAVLPTEDFRIAIEGIDVNGGTFRRINDASIQTANVQLELTGYSSISVQPGHTVNTSVLITNFGAAANWCIKVWDSAGFSTGLQTVNRTLNTNQSVQFNMSFQANSSSTVGSESTVIVTVGNSSVTSLDNYIIFRVTVTSPDYTTDTTPPSCKITANNASACNNNTSLNYCTDYAWIVAFTAQDRESGLYLIMPNTTYSSDAFHVDPFTVGTVSPVSGTYKSSCCLTNATNILAFDRYGNRGLCVAAI